MTTNAFTAKAQWRRSLRLVLFVLFASWWISRIVEAADFVETHVFVAGTEGYHTFRIPALIMAKDGTLLAICEGRKTGRGDHGDVDLVQKRSSDGGKTWSAVELIHEEGGKAKVTIGNPCPVVVSDTGVICFHRAIAAARGQSRAKSPVT
jgi:hypothetical protein